MNTVKVVANLPQAGEVIILDEVMYVDDGYGERSRVQLVSVLTFSSTQELDRWVVENNGKRSFVIARLEKLPFEVNVAVRRDSQ